MSSELIDPEVERESAGLPARPMAFDRFATWIVYIVTFGLGAIATVQIDLWWLLRAGQDIWRTHHVSLVERYSHTADGRYWSNHEWLWEVIAYALYHLGGMPMLSAAIGLTVAGTVWVMRQASRATGYVVPIVLLTAIPLMSVSWTARPQVTSMLLFAVTMVLLARERYVWIPPLFLVWANLHAQVVMGGLLLGGATAAALVGARRTATPEARRRARVLPATLLASGLLTVATPLGTGLWRYVLGANGRPGQEAIAEWATAFHLVVSNVMFWVILVVASVAAVRRRDRLRAWPDRVPLVASIVVAPLAVLAVRNIPFFLVAVLPLLMTLLEFRTNTPVGLVHRWRAGLATTGALTAAAVIAVWIAQPPKLAWHPVSDDLAAALRDCPGPLYNDYNEGAALIWWVPQVKVFLDNRQDPYPAAVIEASIALSPTTYRSVFSRYDVRCAYLPRQSDVVKQLKKDGWRTTYGDASSVVLVPGPTAPRATSATK